MFSNSITSFLRNTGGQVSVLFAIAAVPVLIAGGVAVDRIRLDRMKTEMQAALDGAALAAANADSRTDKQREDVARAFYQENFPGAGEKSSGFTVKVTATKVSASARYDVSTPFMSLAGITKATIATDGEVLREGETYVELAMVLDYSGSMKDNNKYIRMASAATDMVTSLENSSGINKLKVGLVPFSAMVATTMPSQYVTQFSAGTDWTGCTQDRRAPYNTGVSTPNPSDNATKWGYYDNTKENTGAYSCSAYVSNNLTILPLTEDMSKVKSKLTAMKPLGNTNIPLGTEFGWNLLDNKLPYNEAAPYGDPKYKKYLLLLTDGVQTSSQWGPGGSRTVANGNNNLVSLCNGMKAAGITVFTIAYDVTDPAVTTLLKQCAGKNYYQPSVSGSGIADVFATITAEINKQTVRLTK